MLFSVASGPHAQMPDAERAMRVVAFGPCVAARQRPGAPWRVRRHSAATTALWLPCGKRPSTSGLRSVKCTRKSVAMCDFIADPLQFNALHPKLYESFASEPAPFFQKRRLACQGGERFRTTVPFSRGGFEVLKAVVDFLSNGFEFLAGAHFVS